MNSPLPILLLIVLLSACGVDPLIYDVDYGKGEIAFAIDGQYFNITDTAFIHSRLTDNSFSILVDLEDEKFTQLEIFVSEKIQDRKFYNLKNDSTYRASVSTIDGTVYSTMSFPPEYLYIGKFTEYPKVVSGRFDFNLYTSGRTDSLIVEAGDFDLTYELK